MRQWVLANRPDGIARTSDFAMQEAPIPTPDEGQVLGQLLRAVSVLPPLAMTLLDAMNWRGLPLWVGFTDA